MNSMPVREIVFYDHSNFYYSSFFVAGFIDLLGTNVFRISKKIPSICREINLKGKEGIFQDVLLFSLSFSVDEKLWFCIDTSDSCELSSIHIPLLDRVSLYFKVNLAQDLLMSSHGLERSIESPNIWGEKGAKRQAKLRQAMPFCPIRSVSTAQLPRLFPARRVGWKARATLRRFWAIYNTPTLERIAAMRRLPKKYDVVFLTTHYGSPAAKKQMDFRQEIIQRLRESPRLHCRAGFVSSGSTALLGSSLIEKPMPLAKYLELLASGRVGVYVRGLKDCVSFKLTQMLSLALPIVGQSLNSPGHLLREATWLDNCLRFETPDLIVSEVEKLIRQPARQEELSNANQRLFFDRMCPKAVVSKILDDLISVNRTNAPHILGTHSE